MGIRVTFYVDLGDTMELTQDFWFPDSTPEQDIEAACQEWRDSLVSSAWWYDGEKPLTLPTKSAGLDAEILFNGIK